MGVTPKFLFAIVVAGTGSGFQHGYSTGVMNAPQSLIMDWMQVVYEGRGSAPSKDFLFWLWGFVVSIFCLGGILGGAMSSLFSTKLGRKGALVLNNLFAIVAGLLMFAARYLKSPELFIVGRFITGYNCGLNSGICAMYLVEIATTAMRGAIGSVYQLIITMSILLSQICGLESILGNPDMWHYLFLLTTVVGVLQLLLLPLCPESPKYLFVKKGEDECKTALNWLRGGDDIDSELTEIKTETAKEESLGKVSCGQMLSQTVLRSPLIISIMIMLAQQLSGINAVIFYSTSTFQYAGFSSENAKRVTILMGGMNVLMTVVSMFLVDVAGRKTLLLIGFGLMCIITTCLSGTLTFINYSSILPSISVVLIVLYVVAFATGPGSIPWFLVTEFFTQSARPLAASIAAATNWIANFCVGFAFPPLQEYMQAKVFIIFIIFQILFIVYIFIKVPETKNKTYDEISENFK